ncbi:helix-turn-helix domain-containing protein [Actinomyces ruminis]|uniref:DNA-binding protein n=1 Tax=Actinomyces ruminis TaxID=1937003 RepID=A0ABX4MBA5_9ACTO|nr:helix-turn-helix domain-containing protein [Actinomyces ruminis]PHP52606.1 DNA-binding protein [Actinomyces ruminis]
MEYNATITIRAKGDDVDDALVDALRDYHPAVSPSPLAEDAWDAVITFDAETLGQALTTARAIGEHLGGMIGLEVVPTTAWDRRADQDVRSDDDLVGVTDAASRLGVTPQAIRERLATGTLPGRKIGREWVIPARALARR